jgi:hypothetical protein
LYTHTKAHRLLRDAGTRTDTTVHTCYRHMGVHMGGFTGLLLRARFGFSCGRTGILDLVPNYTALA